MTDVHQRCSPWAREAGVDPVGTATSARSWLLVEWPLPWPRDAGDVGPLHELAVAAKAAGARLQLLVPRPEAAELEVVLHRGPGADGWFDGYSRTATRAPAGSLVAAGLALLRGGPTGTDPAAVAHHDGDADAWPWGDLLVCAHGTRDRCCGSLGTSLALRALAAGYTSRRTSHLGGHRFAPTGVVLPSGTCWAFLDEDSVARILTRTGPLDDLLPRYRGVTGLGSPAAQAVERVAFGELGWAWLDHRRRATDHGDGRVTLEAVSPGGAHLRWEAEVEEGRLFPVPDCGRPLHEAKKHEPEVVVRSAHRTSTPAA